MKALFVLALAVSLVVVACQGEKVVEVVATPAPLPTLAPWPTHTPYPTLAPAADVDALPDVHTFPEPDALSYAGGRPGQMGRLPQRDFGKFGPGRRGLRLALRGVDAQPVLRPRRKAGDLPQSSRCAHFRPRHGRGCRSGRPDRSRRRGERADVVLLPIRSGIVRPAGVAVGWQHSRSASGC